MSSVGPKPVAHRLEVAAALAGVSVPRLRQAIRAGELRVVTISPRVRVVMQIDLERWLESRRGA